MLTATIQENRGVEMAKAGNDDMSTTQVAKALGVTVTRVNQLINEKRPDKPKLAAYREPGFGNAWRVERESVMRYLEYKRRLDAAIGSVPWEDAT